MRTEVEMELAMHAIAYNLNRWLLLQAGGVGGVPATTLGFKAGVDAFPDFWMPCARTRANLAAGATPEG